MDIKQTETDVKRIKETLKRAEPTIEEIDSWNRILRIVSDAVRRDTLNSFFDGNFTGGKKRGGQ